MKALSVVPVFHVADIDVAIRFYTEILGFTESFRMGTYVGLKIGPCEIHVTLPGDYERPIGGGTAYIICDEVDEYYVKVRTAGAKTRSEPADRVYGFRDFVVVDVDGNQITFGRDIED